jgi:hypothetical protein
MDGKSAPNVYDEHVFKIQIDFGASTAFTAYAKDIVVARPSATTFTVELPQPYARITSGAELWQKATGADPVRCQITTSALTTTGLLTFTTVSTNSAGTATAPANGDKLWLTVGVSDHDSNDDYTSTG